MTPNQRKLYGHAGQIGKTVQHFCCIAQSAAVFFRHLKKNEKVFFMSVWHSKDEHAVCDTPPATHILQPLPPLFQNIPREMYICMVQDVWVDPLCFALELMFSFANVCPRINQTIQLFISLSGLIPTELLDQCDPQPRHHGRH